MEKVSIGTLNKLQNIIEIIMVLLNCNYTFAFNLVKDTDLYQALVERDYATMYQSAPCCVEDIGRELLQKGNPYAVYFNNNRINNAISHIRNENAVRKSRFTA